MLSGFIKPESVPGQAMDAAFRRGEVLISSMLASEFEAVLDRPKFDRYGRSIPGDATFVLSSMLRSRFWLSIV